MAQKPEEETAITVLGKFLADEGKLMNPLVQKALKILAAHTDRRITKLKEEFDHKLEEALRHRPETILFGASSEEGPGTVID